MLEDTELDAPISDDYTLTILLFDDTVFGYQFADNYHVYERKAVTHGTELYDVLDAIAFGK